MSTPVVEPVAMRAFDDAAPEPVEALIQRAGWAVAVAARRMLGGTYGRRVTVVAGPGNNGADGRVAARWLRAWGARCRIVDPGEGSSRLPASDLVIDAAYGTGMRGTFTAPDPGSVPVLAVDVPSGLDALTGELLGEPMAATRTVTFAALKPGLLLLPGRSRCGQLDVVDVGVPVESADSHIEDEDVARGWPRRAVDSHKWQGAVWLIGGSNQAGVDTSGALRLAASGALRAGASYVRVSVPGGRSGGEPAEAVGHALGEHWAADVLADQDRFGGLVIGPGLAPTEANRAAVAALVAGWKGPLVLDAGALDGLAEHRALLRARELPAVLTPHEGEFARLVGRRPAHRVPEVRAAARDFGSVLLLKGPTTLVADPEGGVRYLTAGDERLATAGSGDVLAGVLVAVLPDPMPSPAEVAGPGIADRAALAAHVHGRAAGSGPPVGLAAGDLPGLIGRWLSEAVYGGRA